MERKKVSVLFAEKNGNYSKLNFVDLWDIERDAMKFNGDLPVIAHPPCNLWGRFALINYKRYGGEHNKPRSDGGKFLFALDCMRKNGGVLEHPAYSYAWDEYDLLKPKHKKGWARASEREWVCEVYQSVYGHLARKRTWLIYCGNKEPFELDWSTQDGIMQIGGCDNKRGRSRNKKTISKKDAIFTPVLFMNELIRLALWSAD